MASVPVLDASGKKVGDQALDAVMFEAKINVPLMHQVVVAGLAGIRAGTHATKTRADVSGGGKKPWRQKGTGRARHGSIRSPIWRGGGASHGPQPRNYEQRTPKKMKLGALRSALSDALASGKLIVLDSLAFDEPKTKVARQLIESLELSGRILLVLPEPHDAIEKSFRNLPYVRVVYTRSLGTYEILAADFVVFTKDSLAALDVKPESKPESKPKSKPKSKPESKKVDA